MLQTLLNIVKINRFDIIFRFFHVFRTKTNTFSEISKWNKNQFNFLQMWET